MRATDLPPEERHARLQLYTMYEKLQCDDEILRALISSLLEELYRLERAMQNLSRESNYESITSTAREFLSGVRNVYDPTLLQLSMDLLDGGSRGDLHKTFQSWLNLHRHLYPLALTMRKYLELGPDIFDEIFL